MPTLTRDDSDDAAAEGSGSGNNSDKLEDGGGNSSNSTTENEDEEGDEDSHMDECFICDDGGGELFAVGVSGFFFVTFFSYIAILCSLTSNYLV